MGFLCQAEAMDSYGDHFLRPPEDIHYVYILHLLVFHSPEPELPLMQTSESPQVIFAQYLGAVLELNFAVVILTA